MKFCLSNLAWSKKENIKIIELLNQKKINLLEYAPTLILKNLNSDDEIKNVRKFWEINKIKLYSMQSILFEIKDAYIFGNIKERKKFLIEVKKKIILANKLGTKIIVFGSPKTKKTFGKSKKKLNQIFYNMFKKIASISAKYNIIFCIESNPKFYKTTFLTHTKNALYFVKKINSRNLKINLDLGTVTYNKENLDELLEDNINLIGHAQISSPGLRNLLRYKKQTKHFLRKLNNYGYKKVVSVESLGGRYDNYKKVKKILKLIK